MKINFGEVTLKKKIQLGNVKIGIKKVYPELENIEITPSAEEQIFNHPNSYGYDEIKVNPIETEEISITPSAKEQIVEGIFSKVTVKAIETYEVTITPSKEEQIVEGVFSKVTVAGDDDLDPKNIAKDKEIFGIEGTAKTLSVELTDGSYFFYKNRGLSAMKDLLKLFTKLTSAYNMYVNATELLEIKAEDFEGIDTTELKDISYMFSGCSKMTSLDLSFIKENKIETMYYMCGNCSRLLNVNANSMDTSNVKNAGSVFYRDTDLVTLDVSEWDLGNATNVSDFVGYSSNLTNFKPPKNIGKGFTQKTNNYYAYKQDYSNNKKLTHESLVDIGDSLHDLNLTYDVANGGTLYTHQVILGSINIAKLTPSELAVYTKKGYSVS